MEDLFPIDDPSSFKTFGSYSRAKQNVESRALKTTMQKILLFENRTLGTLEGR